jgi:hypothetical protein
LDVGSWPVLALLIDLCSFEGAELEAYIELNVDIIRALLLIPLLAVSEAVKTRRIEGKVQHTVMKIGLNSMRTANRAETITYGLTRHEFAVKFLHILLSIVWPVWLKKVEDQRIDRVMKPKPMKKMGSPEDDKLLTDIRNTIMMIGSNEAPRLIQQYSYNLAVLANELQLSGLSDMVKIAFKNDIDKCLNVHMQQTPFFNDAYLEQSSTTTKGDNDTINDDSSDDEDKFETNDLKSSLNTLVTDDDKKTEADDEIEQHTESTLLVPNSGI